MKKVASGISTNSYGIRQNAGTEKPNQNNAVTASRAVTAFPYIYMRAPAHIHITKNAVTACYAVTKMFLKGFFVPASNPNAVTAGTNP